MAQSIRIELNPTTIGAVLKSGPVVAMVRSRIEAIAAAAGPGHKTSTYMGRDRVRGMVWTSTWEAKRAEATTRSLTRAVDAGR